MKKRIKLTDKELAIGMWVYICLYIESYNDEYEGHEYISSLKRRWLEEHYKINYTIGKASYWENNCWLCNKYWLDHCSDCPLIKCGMDSLYDKVTDYYLNKDYQIKALKCAKKILNVMQEVEDEDS